MQLKRWPKAVLSEIRGWRSSRRFPLEPLMSPYVFAVLVSVAALMARMALHPVFGQLHPFLLSYGAVALVSVRSGLGPSILATILGFLGSDYLFLEPRHSFRFSPELLASSITYFALCALVVALAEANHRTKQKLRRNDWQFRRFLDSNMMPIIRGTADEIIDANAGSGSNNWVVHLNCRAMVQVPSSWLLCHSARLPIRIHAKLPPLKRLQHRTVNAKAGVSWKPFTG